MPLGAQNGVLPDSSFTATSSATSREAYRARLHGQFAWRPRQMDSNEYLVVDFQSRVIITSVATQGRRAAREFVTLYALQYSDNGNNWFYYTDGNKIIMVSLVCLFSCYRIFLIFYLLFCLVLAAFAFSDYQVSFSYFYLKNYFEQFFFNLMTGHQWQMFSNIARM